MKAAASLALLLALAIGAQARADGVASSLQLADRLRLAHDYPGCAVEALRHAFAEPADREPGIERAAFCLGLAGRHGDAERILRTLEPPLSPAARFRLCHTEVFLEPAPDEDCDAAAGSPDRLSALATHARTMHALRAGRWEEARHALAAAPPLDDPTLAAWRAEDLALVARAASRPRRSPWIATALSAVVPGLGRVYVGRWQDGLMSALAIGIPAGFAANGFSEKGAGSVRGWILGTLAGVLYVGNVYGSYVGVGVEEREAERRLLAEVNRALEARAAP